ncbi:MAG: deoxyribodipyrimidine photo-lyase [Phycisphaerales bacterium]|nr:deoxyribodipyrimidine photo-lyase [Phycisphaerales bacterium]
MRSMVLLRNDLRLTDNAAIDAAYQEGKDGTIALFFLTPKQWQLHGVGSPRVSFMLNCLRSLQIELEKSGTPLLIEQVDTYEDIPLRLQSIASQHDCQSIHVNREPGIDERNCDDACATQLGIHDISFQVHDSNTILPIHEIVTGSGSPYRVFTPFCKQWHQQLESRGLPVFNQPEVSRVLDLESGTIPNEIPGFIPWKAQHLWKAGSDAAHVLLDKFLDDAILKYNDKRDVPGETGTSTLSPWLATGAISPITILRKIYQRFGENSEDWNIGVKSWVNELVWREFYRHVMHGFPKVSMNQPMVEWAHNIQWREDSAGLQAWQEGSTGIDIIDAGMMQLKETGWMHNRVRMITAMFLTKNLLIHWRHGESYFSRHLVDYDFSSNNGGWQWAASTGTDAAPYFRIFNPVRQADTWDTSRTYIKRWLNRTPMSLDPIVDLQVSRRRAIETFRAAKEFATDKSKGGNQDPAIRSDAI